MTQIKTYVSNQIPDYIRDNDSYKDVDDKGFVERYLEIFGDELDEFQVAKLDNFPDQISPFTMDDIYLDYIAYTLGDIPNLTPDIPSWRNFLSHVVSIWKIKGTKKSFRAILLPLRVVIANLDTDIEEIVPANYIYDSIYAYDQGVQYDKNCPTCTRYNLKLTSILPLTADLYNRIIGAIKLVEPLGAVMNELEWNGEATEVIGPIQIWVDENGDLQYNNDADPGLIITLGPNGDLIFDGPNAARYYLDPNGDVYYIDF